MLHADERLEEIILAALLVLCTTVMMVAEHGGLGRAGESGPLIRVGLDLIATGGTKPIPPKAQAPGSGAQMEGLATATLESPNPLVPTPSAPSAATTRLSSRDLGLLPLDFTLEPPGSERATARRADDGAVIVSKPLLAEGTALGKMDITVADGATLMLEAQQARRVLAGQSGKVSAALDRLPEKGLVSFADLRALGIDLRYSPTEDVIRLNP